jgi:Tol biopolymer transport system component
MGTSDGDDPSISADGRTIAFRSTRDDNGEIYMSTRSCQ